MASNTPDIYLLPLGIIFPCEQQTNQKVLFEKQTELTLHLFEKQTNTVCELTLTRGKVVCYLVSNACMAFIVMLIIITS